MFSFHRPKVYRSGSGCCICRAKSSSSRFTDSKRYEDDFELCFKLCEVRTGEICNACVLLVKRWKKLPAGSVRNWNHVVDARAGHGSRPLSKINKKKAKVVKALVRRENLDAAKKKQLLFMPEIAHHSGTRSREMSPSGFSDDVQLECLSSESESINSSRETTPVPSPNPPGTSIEDPSVVVPLNCQNLAGNSRRRRVRGKHPKKFCSSVTSFLDLNFWRREKTCCGVIFKGPFGELLLDRRYLNPCYCRSNPSSETTSPELENVPTENRLECFEIESGISNLTVDAFRVLTNVSTTTPADTIKANNGQCKVNSFNESYVKNPQNISND